MGRFAPFGLAALLAMVVLSWSAVPVAAEDVLLADGDPPLTQSMVDRARGFYEWLLDATMTEQQRGDFQQSLVDSWDSGDEGQIANLLDVLKNADGLDQYTAEERRLVRDALQPDVLEQLRAQSDDPGSAWLLALYDSGHMPIAEGNPPLTRQMADATTESLTFMLAKAFDREYVTPAADVKDAFAEYLISEYPSYRHEQQDAIASMPVYWAAISVYWPIAPEEKREALRQEWADQLGPMLPAEGDGAVSQPEDPPAASDEKPMSWAAFNTLQLAKHQTFLSSVSLIRGNYTAAYTYGHTPW